MAERDERYEPAFRGLFVGVLIVVGVALFGITLTWGANVVDRRDRLYPMPTPHCSADRSCEEKVLQIAAREAVTSDAAAQLALWQLVLSGLGIVGVGLTVYYAHQAWREAQRSANVAHQDFVATHRPRIRVRFIVDDSDSVGARKAWITIANVGESVATIMAIGGGLSVRSRLTKNWAAPGVKTSAEGRGAPADNVLRAGESRTYWISSPSNVSASQLQEMTNAESDLIACGEIRYRDSNHILRHTGFFWRWNPMDREFSPLDEPGKNYED